MDADCPSHYACFSSTNRLAIMGSGARSGTLWSSCHVALLAARSGSQTNSGPAEYCPKKGAAQARPVPDFGHVRLRTRSRRPTARFYGLCQEIRRHLAWRKFLRRLDLAIPAHLARIGSPVRRLFRDLAELILVIGDYIDRHKENRKPFLWTARATDIVQWLSALVAPWINRQSL